MDTAKLVVPLDGRLPSKQNEELLGVKRSREHFEPTSPESSSPRAFPPLKKLRHVNYSNRWAYLPRGVLVIVLTYFSKPELIRLGLVCKHWYDTSRLNVLWRSLHNFTGFKVANLNDVCSLFDDVFRGRAPIMELTLPKNCATLSSTEFHRLRLTCLDLRELNLPPANNETVPSIDDACLRELASMKTLRKIYLSTHQQISDDGVVDLIHGLSQTLTHINVDHCRGINPRSLITALRTCTKLESISALFCPNASLAKSHLIELTAEEPIARRLECLAIELADNACEQRNVIHDFLKQYRNSLKSLHLREWRHINPIMSDELTMICKSLTSLEKLTVSCNTIIATDTVTTNRSALLIETDSIQEILLSRFENLNRPIFKCAALKKLHLESIMSLQDISLLTPKLYEMKIRSCRLELNEQNTPFDKILETVPSLQKLEVLDCMGISRLNITQRTAEGLKDLSLFMCSDLEEINLKCDSLAILNIDACQELKRARLECPNLVTAKLFAKPAPMQFPIMDHLYLSSNHIQNLSLPRCVNLQVVELVCPNLISINMNECKVLQELTLHCSSLEKLALSGPRMTFDTSFADNLGTRCPKVHMLQLSNIPIDDDALGRVSRWKNLRALVISNCERLIKPALCNNKELKGLQLLDCPNLEMPIVHCDKLVKLFYRNCPKLSDAALSCIRCAELKFIEVLNCANLENVRFVSRQCQNAQFVSCPRLSLLEFDTPDLLKLSVSDCPTFRHLTFSQTAPNLSEFVLEKCLSFSDDGFIRASEMTPNVKACHIKQCHGLQVPIIPWAHLKLIDLLECRSLSRPRLHYSIPQATVSFKGCPKLNFQDFAEITQSVDFVEIVNCEGLAGKVRFPLQGMSRLNIALCHHLGAIELYTNHMAPSRLEKLLITHCRELHIMRVESNQRPIIAQLKECPHLIAPILEPPARIVARMMGCYSLGCQGNSSVVERHFGQTQQPVNMIPPPHVPQQQTIPAQRVFPFPIQQQQQQQQQGGMRFPMAMLQQSFQ